MNVAVLRGTARAVGVGDVVDVDVDETGLTLAGTRLRADCNGIAELFVLWKMSGRGKRAGNSRKFKTHHNNVVRPAGGQIVEEAREVSRSAEVLRRARVDVEQLLHVEELNAVVDGLGANDHVLLVTLYLTPSGERRMLRQASEVLDLAVLCDLGESGAIFLTDGNELATVLGDPAPSVGTLTSEGTKVGV